MNIETGSPMTRGAGAGEIGFGPVSLEPYRDETFFEGERANLFGRAWLLVGRVEEVARPGDFVIKDVEVRNTSILITRGKDDALRAFHNVCPHRGNQIVWEKSGSASAFVCRYHAWTFGTNGALRGVPDQAMFPGLDKASCGLTPIAIEIWDGWIFVNLAVQPEVSLDEYLGAFKPFYAGVEYLNLKRPVVIETRLACNWKVVMDAFAEAYHIPTLHPATLRSIFSTPDNAFGRPLQTAFFGPHAMNSMFGNPEYMPTPTQAAERIAYDPAYFPADQAAGIGRYLAHPAVNPTNAKSWSMDVNYVFPNTHINANLGGLFVHQFWPIGQNETRHEARFYLREPRTVRERFAQEHTVAHAVDIVLEDVSNVERTQRGINSRGTATMQLSESEVLIRHSLHHIRRWTEAATVAAAMGGEASR